MKNYKPKNGPVRIVQRLPWESRRRTETDKLQNLNLSEMHVLEAIQHARATESVTKEYLDKKLVFDTTEAIGSLLRRKAIKQQDDQYELW